MKYVERIIMFALCICVLVFAANTITAKAESPIAQEPDYLYVMMHSLYNEAVEGGYPGTFTDYVTEAFKGPQGEPGTSDIWKAANCGVQSSVVINSFFSTDSGIGAKGGSGVIYSLNKETGDAFIITNYHVISGFDKSGDVKTATLAALWTYGMEISESNLIPAYVCGTAPEYDLAVLRVYGDGQLAPRNNVLKTNNAIKSLTALERNAGVTLGSSVVVVGNPMGYGMSVTTGIVSVTSEDIYISHLTVKNGGAQKIRVIRTNAEINGGNSGGGMFDKNGRLIGIVNAKDPYYLDGYGNIVPIEGMGYAIPSDIVVRVADQILAKYSGTVVKVGKPSAANLGIITESGESGFKPETAFDQDGNSIAVVQSYGKFVVKTVSTDFAAAGKNGFVAGDEILSMTYTLNPGTALEHEHTVTEVNNLYELEEALIDCWHGGEISFEVKRAGGAVTVTIANY